AFLFKRLRDPKEWQRFFETRADLIGSANPAQHAVAQLLSQRGLKNHFKSQISKSKITVDRVHVSPPVSRMLPNGSEFFEYRMGELNRSGELIALEVVFRHELTSQSSALGRYPESGFKAGQIFDAPFLECFSKLE